MDDRLDLSHVRRRFGAEGDGPIGAWTSVTVLERVGSSNVWLREHGRVGDVVVALEQTAGRGRLGRVWDHVPGAGLAVSAMLPRPVGADDLPVVPLRVGLALHRAVGALGLRTTALKWPNDLLAADGRKLAGVLCELTPAGVVAGWGLNVAHEADQLPVPEATSLRLAGLSTTREEVLAAWLAETEVLLTMPRTAVLEEYRRACATVGSQVAVTLPGGEVLAGVAGGLDEIGRLRVRVGERWVTVGSGDVVHTRMTRRPEERPEDDGPAPPAADPG